MSEDDKSMDDAPHAKTQGEVVRLSIPMLLILLVVIVLALYVGTQVISVLYNIVVPPMPPLPPAARQENVTNIAYGVDDWDYSVAEDPCQVAAMYTAEGAVCRITPASCDNNNAFINDASARLVARCFGQIDFSLFTMQYEAVINRDEINRDHTDLRLIREIFWVGEGRQAEISSTETSTLTQ